MTRYKRPKGYADRAMAMMSDLTYPLFDAVIYAGLAVSTYDADHHLIIDTGGDCIEAVLSTRDDALRIAHDHWLSLELLHRNMAAYANQRGLSPPKRSPRTHKKGRRYQRLFRHALPSPLP